MSIRSKEAIRNTWIKAILIIINLQSGLGPGTLVGSAAFDLFPIHAVCVVVPNAGSLKKISDIGVWLVELFWSFWAYIWLYIILRVWTPNVVTLWESLLTVLQFGLLLIHAYAQDQQWPYVSLPLSRDERPMDWVPEEASVSKQENLVQHHSDFLPVDDHQGPSSQALLANEAVEPVDVMRRMARSEYDDFLLLWKQQFAHALMFESDKSEAEFVRWARLMWHMILLPWRLMFAFVPPYHVAHGWIAFFCSLTFISGIAYVVTKITDLISCVTGINAYVIALTALAAGTSWPDLVASKIAAERQTTADSAIANVTCSNAVNIYIGIGIPWLIHTFYNFFTYNEALRIEDAAGLSFSLLVFFTTSVGCIGVLVLRRLVFGAELGGPKGWAWLTSVYFMSLWLIFVILSSLKFSGIF